MPSAKCCPAHSPVPPVTDLAPIPDFNIRLEICALRRQFMSTLVLDKKADLAGPGIGDYKELEKILPNDYRSLLTPKETQEAIFQVKRYIADNLCEELHLMMVEVPLIVDTESG